ncbi:BolA family protein [Noviherbaspirillum denitrificans]|uniref:BolA family transcriptional regulator n=1 Tax=Noviherbaspirillum denitrificans TaxID=1968433 RepID=A0A254TN43_9BURK|nr:BolA family protein [Noviherbaspirillum denitrificans]OWW21128.1 BolA family transcriptional regulator [Noviherbaspirillum denitrificans]
MSERIEKIRSLLTATFAPVECQLVDDSHLHAGHAGAASGAGHFSLRIVSDRFDGLNRVARHRLVYDCLRDMMTSDIHALNIIALAPSEVAN